MHNKVSDAEKFATGACAINKPGIAKNATIRIRVNILIR
jgi:hypothetical protein